MRVAIYVRVSTTDQAEEGYSVDEQIDKLKKYCDIKDWGAPKVYTDAGFSGSNIKRPGLQKLIKDVKAGRVETVLVYKLDRLSRSQKDTLYLIEDVFNEAGAAFLSLQENFDTSTAFGKAMIGILSVFAQLEREQIKERMQMGKVGRIKSGKPSAWAKPPFGYNYSDGEYQVNELQASVVKRIFKDYNAGISITKLKDYLNEEGHIGKDVAWSYRTVRVLLANALYAGFTNFHGHLYKGNHTPIISKELYDKTQEELEKRQKKAYAQNNNPRPFQAKYMLSGLLFCGYCGARFSVILGAIRKDGTRYRRYQCYSTSPKGRVFTNKQHGPCPSKRYDMEPIENVILGEIEKLKIDPSLITDITSESNDDLEREALESRTAELYKKLEKLVGLYLDDSLPLEVLNQKKNNYQQEKDAIEAKLENMAENKKELSVKDATSILSKTPADIRSLSYDDQKLLVKQLISKITLTADTVRVYWRFA